MTEPPAAWQDATAGRPPLGDRGVHLWRAFLDAEPAALEAAARLLSEDEHARAGRFHFERHRRHFTLARGFLRTVLGLYLDIGPETVAFQYNRYGKPSLPPRLGDRKLCFNLSHSGDWALCAVTRGREIGVDIEKIQPHRATAGIARRFFSPREVDALFALPEHLRAAAFFRCWTRKEAYIKAKGRGLSISLASFAVALAPEQPAALIWTGDDPEERHRWSLDDIDLDDIALDNIDADIHASHGYAAALAVEGPQPDVRLWNWGSLPPSKG